MKKILNQVATEDAEALDEFIQHGKKRILANREFCGLSMSDFATFYFEMHDGKLANALVKFALTANCDKHNTLLSLLGFQEFALDALNDFLISNADAIIKEFNRQRNEEKMERSVFAAGY